MGGVGIIVIKLLVKKKKSAEFGLVAPLHHPASPPSLLRAGEGLLSPENPDKPSSRTLPFPPEIKVSCLSARMQKPLPSQHYINIAADKGMHNGVLD